MPDVLHTGIIYSISNQHIQVKVLQEAACSSCAAKRLCTTSEGKVKLINVYNADSANFKVGDEVNVFGATSMGTSAVMIAFGIPLLATVLWLPLSLWLLKFSDLMSVGMLFVIYAMYFIVLHLFKDKIGKDFTFTIEKT